jgi:hypothetical protein
VVKKLWLPNSHTCIKNEWGFKIKHNRIFRAQLEACSYIQISGVEFHERFAPVSNDVTDIPDSAGCDDNLYIKSVCC